MPKRILCKDTLCQTLNRWKISKLVFRSFFLILKNVGPSYFWEGPTLEFDVLGERINFTDLQTLKIRLMVSRVNEACLRTSVDASSISASYLSKNRLHSLFSERHISADVVRLSNSNGTSARKAFIEAEFPSDKTAINIWLHCQGYDNEDGSSKIYCTDGKLLQPILKKTISLERWRVVF